MLEQGNSPAEIAYTAKHLPNLTYPITSSNQIYFQSYCNAIPIPVIVVIENAENSLIWKQWSTWTNTICVPGDWAEQSHRVI